MAADPNASEQRYPPTLRDNLEEFNGTSDEGLWDKDPGIRHRKFEVSMDGN